MGTPDRPELGDELTDSFCRTDPAMALVFARTTFLSDNRADLRRVSVPTLVIECAHDTLAPREVGNYVRSAHRRQQLVTLDATGHCPHLSAPEATAEAIAAFARDAPRAPNQPAASGAASSAQFVADNDVDDLYENAPCGYVSATPDGEITRVNTTFAPMLGYHPRALVGMAFTELLTVGGRIHYETHFAPMLLLAGPARRDHG